MQGEQYCTLAEAAEHARVCTRTIERALARGDLRRVKNGVRKILIAYSELVRWMTNGGRRK